MQENISSKELMLKKIRKALLEKRDNPYPNLEETPLYKANTEIPEILFAEQLTAVSGNFIYCEDGVEFIENILELADKFKWRKIYCWETELQNLLSTYEFPFYKTDKDFEMAEVGITMCEALIARNGSILLSNQNEAGRRLSIFPHHHIVIARTGQMVMDLKDGFQLIKNKYGSQLPSMISTITGPSRTADIEKTLVLGAHGPKELFVFLIDDFS
ncbi:L-lactate dehydrogenase complex protein LldG [Pedobacter cryoconitis]|uniref:L-lactate dehydrogenase complex protein LldG n=1 Tax=Pedobacter cryoconitis TaxID=188932 RepID=A0A7W8ZKG0_9SPHI|nr:LUD domain-containing protein [Pedobacter cryoconitis]MBB5635522.1 L-lactate dehydrogenase complex protein LldG [Pedobacter cryoconitis]MBB6273616.1 L-lactate dehydrogenase complex protein LldG [Pedobacter cryoconitis]